MDWIYLRVVEYRQSCVVLELFSTKKKQIREMKETIVVADRLSTEQKVCWMIMIC